MTINRGAKARLWVNPKPGALIAAPGGDTAVPAPAKNRPVPREYPIPASSAAAKLPWEPHLMQPSAGSTVPSARRSLNAGLVVTAAGTRGASTMPLLCRGRGAYSFPARKGNYGAFRRKENFGKLGVARGNSPEMIKATTAIDNVARLVSLSSSRWCLGRGAKSREVVARGCKPGLCCVHSPGHHHQSALYWSASIGDYFCRTLRFCLNRVRADLLGNFVRKCRSVCPKHVSWPR
jgi:hypothetical protein